MRGERWAYRWIRFFGIGSLLGSLGWAQGLADSLVRGWLLDPSGEPVPFAIVENRRTSQGTLSDLQGRFSLKARPTDTLAVRCVGYEPAWVVAAAVPAPWVLQPRPIEVEPVVIRPEENPAYALVRRALAQRERWDPSRRSHTYLSYNKLTLSLPESLQKRADTLLPPYLFLWETETEKTYFSPNRQRERLRAQRVVGNLPLQTVLSPTAFQPFSLYSDWLEVLDKRFPSPLGRQALDVYDYRITDTTYSGGDTLYTLVFSPRREQATALRGQLTLVFPEAALYTFQGQLSWVPTETGISEPVSYTIQQQYEKVADSVWFPTQLHAEVGLRVRTNASSLVFLVRSRSFLREVSFSLPEKLPSGSEVVLPAQVAPLTQRAETLSAAELEGYQFLDSLLSETPLVRFSWLFDLPTLLSGRLPVGRFHVILRPLLLFHQGEGLRPQLGLETNDRFVRAFRLRGWVGYGTGRQAGLQGTPWRYGAELDFGQLALLRLFAYEDVRERSMPRLLEERPSLLLAEQSPYEQMVRGYAFDWGALVREGAWGFLVRLPVLPQWQMELTGAAVERSVGAERWRGYRTTVGVEYLYRQELLRRGSTVWRSFFKGPRLRLRLTGLWSEALSTPPAVWAEGDLWQEWRWKNWAIMRLRLSGGVALDSLPSLWLHRLRTLPKGYLGQPFALAAWPVQLSATQCAYAFYEWTVPNMRFPSHRWSPELTLHLQGAWAEGVWYPEAGLSVQNWVPQALRRFLASLATLRLGVYVPLPKAEGAFVRISQAIF